MNPGLKLPLAILGVPFDPVTLTEALDTIEQMLRRGSPHYLVTANVDFVVQARNDTELRRIFHEAHMVLCDGTPLVWVSRLLGNPLPERVAGADLVPLLIERAAERGHRLFFLGAAPESCERAVARMRERFPTLKLAGYYSPPFNKLLEMDHDEIKKRIVAARPDLLFVSFGCPKQEKWMAMHYRSLGVPVTIGVGATIDFLAGQVRRAPVWMQRSGLEWSFRLAQEPRRLFERYAKDLGVFGSSIIRQWWLMGRAGGKARRSSNSEQPTLETSRDSITAKLPPLVTIDFLKATARWVDQIMHAERHCFLESSRVEVLDSSGVALLLRLERALRTAGRQLILVAPSNHMRDVLALMRLGECFALASDFAEAERMVQKRLREETRTVLFPIAGVRSVLQWRGEVTAANAEEVWHDTRGFIEEAVALEESVIIELSDLRFIDSSGLGIMVRARKFAQRNGIELRFEGANGAVRNVIDLARLAEFFGLNGKPKEPEPALVGAGVV